MNRRALLGGAVALPVMAVATLPAAAVVTVDAGRDAQWTTVVADFRAKYASWFANIDVEDAQRAAFREARASLGPKPQEPAAPSRGDVLDKTVRELRDACEAPGHKAAWAAYERDQAAWNEREAELRERMMAPAEAHHDALYKARADAFLPLSTYPVRSLADLAEKIGIVMADYDGENVPQEYLADFLADVRRLGGDARA